MTVQGQRHTSHGLSLQHPASAPRPASPSRRQSQQAHARCRHRSYASSSCRHAPDFMDDRAAHRCCFENSYRLEPSADQRFHACYARPIISQVLQVTDPVASCVKKYAGQEVAIFRQTAANFRQRKLRVLKIAILPLNFTKMGKEVLAQFCIFGR